jgi:hypothetical protein
MWGDHDWELALIVRKVKVMEVSNNTDCPTIGCLSNVPQETKLRARNGRSNKDKEEGENRSGKVVTVLQLGVQTSKFR